MTVQSTWYKKRFFFQREIIWEVNNRRNMGNVRRHEQKQEINRKFLSNVPNPYTKCRLNTWTKVDYHTGGKWFVHCPKHHKENQLLSLEHPCRLSLDYVNLIQRRSMVTCSIRFSKRKPVGKNMSGKRTNADTISHMSTISYQADIANIRYTA